MKPNRAGILHMIRAAEGTDAPDGYRALFGFHPTLRSTRLFDNGFARHPNIRFPFTQTDGKVNYSTAAGAYQFIFPTWQYVSDRIGAPDFSPAWQDEAALSLIEVECAALEDVDAGDVEAAILKMGGQWASLPSARYPQTRRTLDFCLAAFADGGGVIA